VAIKVFRTVRTVAVTKRVSGPLVAYPLYANICLYSQKLEREMRVWASLEHPNILPFYGYCEGFGKYGASISPVSYLCDILLEGLTNIIQTPPQWCQNGHAESYIQENSIKAPQRFKLVCYIKFVTFK
jgi:hypothetical protein